MAATAERIGSFFGTNAKRIVAIAEARLAGSTLRCWTIPNSFCEVTGIFLGILIKHTPQCTNPTRVMIRVSTFENFRVHDEWIGVILRNKLLQCDSQLSDIIDTLNP